MIKLKTLKEIEEESTGFPIKFCKSEELIKEAIKWIKFLIEKDNHDHDFSKGKCEYCSTYMSEVDWIKKFFNLTRRDLK